MARGRMLNKTISLSRQVNTLSDDTSRLIFTWAIAHLDRDGRMHGDPVVVMSTVAPRLPHITPERIGQYIREWAEAGLVVWYESDGDAWLQFPKFRENQPRLRYEREQPSRIPPPEGCRMLATAPDSQCRSNSGVTPDKLRSDAGEGPAEEKLREVNIKSPPQTEDHPPSASGDTAALTAPKLLQKINEWIIDRDNIYPVLVHPELTKKQWGVLKQMARRIGTASLVYDVMNGLHNDGALEKGLITELNVSLVDKVLDQIAEEMSFGDG